MKKHLYAVLGILLMASCQEKDDLSPVVGVNEKTSNENPFAISEEEALANLEAFLAGSEEAETRGLSVKSVSSIVPVKYNMAMTKAGGSDVNCENLLYVANFEQEQGYAIPYILCRALNVIKSHSWNIDGYKIKERTVKTDVYSGMWLKETKTRKETCKMVHCDFGWQGRCNGYYVSGVFKLNDPNIEHDSGDYDGSNHYNKFLNIITYDKP